MDFFLWLVFHLGQERPWQELDFLILAPDHLAAAQVAQYPAGETIQRYGVSQQTHAIKASQARHGQGSRLASATVGLLFIYEAHRQLIVLGTAATLDLHLAEYRHVRSRAEGYRVQQPDLRRIRALPGEPAAVGQVARQGFALQHIAAGFDHQLVQTAFDHQRAQFRHGLQRGRVPGRHLRFLGQQEPEKAVGGQCQQIVEFADRWKRGATDHLHRHRTLVRGQLQLGGLGRTRQVGDAEDGLLVAVFAFVLAYIGDDPPVGGGEHLQGAAAKGLLLLAHRQHPACPVEQRVGITQLGLDIDGLEAV